MGTEVKPVGSARDGDTPSLVMLLGFSKGTPEMTNYFML